MELEGRVDGNSCVWQVFCAAVRLRFDGWPYPQPRSRYLFCYPL